MHTLWVNLAHGEFSGAADRSGHSAGQVLGRHEISVASSVSGGRVGESVGRSIHVMERVRQRGTFFDPIFGGGDRASWGEHCICNL